jgi:hypothetical protein
MKNPIEKVGKSTQNLVYNMMKRKGVTLMTAAKLPTDKSNTLKNLLKTNS